MSQVGFYVDLTRCVGCRACQIACKDKNRIMEPGVLFRRVDSWETGSFPDAHLYHVSASCNHCAQAACVENCPTGAMYKAEDGTVLHDDELCIGCETCAHACPYQVPVLFADEGKVHKCDSCKVLRDQGGNPACVDSCPMRALDFGDLDELRGRYGSDLVIGVPAWKDGGTCPSVLFKANDAVLTDSPREVII